MPIKLRKTLLDNLDIIFPGALKIVDTSAEEFSNMFLAVHMSWYNRYSEHVRLLSLLFYHLNQIF